MNRFRPFLTYTALAALALAVLAARFALGDAPTKGRIERPAKELIAARSATAPAPAPFDNPKVAPGKVAWHPGFAAACQASRASGKPVLLFQMMGKLDEQFC